MTVTRWTGCLLLTPLDIYLCVFTRMCRPSQSSHIDSLLFIFQILFHFDSYYYSYCSPTVSPLHPIVSILCPYCVPIVSLLCPYCVPIVFTLCPYCVPIVSLLCPYCVPIVFILCPYYVPIVSLLWPYCAPIVFILCP